MSACGGGGGGGGGREGGGGGCVCHIPHRIGEKLPDII